MLLQLTIDERFEFINRIGLLPSTKKSLVLLDDLIETLTITKDEAEDPNLNLSFNPETGSFNYNEEYAPKLEVELSDEILEILKGE